MAGAECEVGKELVAACGRGDAAAAWKKKVEKEREPGREPM